ncbi:lantibiotic dehydratase C-terminal domain-containing protein [Microbulbifer sp. 2205BS26-8]|uniref:lantibiotic dehydratase C-terminal domain-containing protein n=1 Tax=Microbulbifer sp. 2205BS26-8 TaxID=3064386 RepID=UPI00273FA59F|nr:lantibiotic dehydratase C-terminal domain-containing protein [Microbulbifer sp. 2205BS26-8]MDP5210777.1 lantibiotic dehydratase C-terminal domain-containing protein [Microbulbifer sp. 2205BS26-8]
MSNRLNAIAPAKWIYFKLYLGQAIDRMDQLLVKLEQVVSQMEAVESWFYIRYFDDQGVHIRLRVLPQAREEDLKKELNHRCATLLNALHDLLPSNYYPMVVPVGYDEAIEEGKVPGGHNDVRIVSDVYEPETDKFGGELGVKIAEAVFQVSSEIACNILSDEVQGFYSRKDLIPLLMSECFNAFLSEGDAVVFWREYSFYWLGGNSPAAGDWRDKFFRKGEELAEQGVVVVPDETQLKESQLGYVKKWRDVLDSAAARYHELRADLDANTEVLAFNFIHLMNNRLGIASLEEAYMATLLEQRARDRA